MTNTAPENKNKTHNCTKIMKVIHTMLKKDPEDIKFLLVFHSQKDNFPTFFF